MLDIFNIDVDKKRTSILQPLLLFYLLILTSPLNELLSKQLKTFVEENRIVQHFLGFLLLIVLIMTLTDISNVAEVLLYATLIYIMFIFSTKMDIYWTIIVLILIFFGYMYDKVVQTNDDVLTHDANTSPAELTDIKNTHRQYIMYGTIAIIGVIATGTMLYYHKKETQYGGGYNTLTYLFY